ncbi:MAG: hypothetical protein KKC76_20510 [Proteobacteria bacterium]|nr:hypothetical protein [Pseudomonadota bacterium]MBU4264240.1 hypothetical protein [Pseudomonadota bacterium]MBU4298359.1 hypothetical protein [Pseudomonadota bacterium]MCG2746914.1 hypothetical protein [Desulfobulbaceae bacterium]
MKQKKEFDYFDRPETIKKLWILLYVVCVLTIVPDFFTDRHAYFGVDGYFGFFALLGFISCAVLILFSKLIALVLKTKEDYYDR